MKNIIITILNIILHGRRFASELAQFLRGEMNLYNQNRSRVQKAP